MKRIEWNVLQHVIYVLVFHKDGVNKGFQFEVGNSERVWIPTRDHDCCFSSILKFKRNLSYFLQWLSFSRHPSQFWTPDVRGAPTLSATRPDPNILVGSSPSLNHTNLPDSFEIYANLPNFTQVK